MVRLGGTAFSCHKKVILDIDFSFSYIYFLKISIFREWGVRSKESQAQVPESPAPMVYDPCTDYLGPTAYKMKFPMYLYAFICV